MLFTFARTHGISNGKLLKNSLSIGLFDTKWITKRIDGGKGKIEETNENSEGIAENSMNDIGRIVQNDQMANVN